MKVMRKEDLSVISFFPRLECDECEEEKSAVVCVKGQYEDANICEACLIKALALIQSGDAAK